MKFPDWLKVYGDTSYRGKCPLEDAEQITFFSEIRKRYPQDWGVIALHPRNEGKRTHGQTTFQKLEGMTDGACDIVIGGFYCELKRRDHTKSKWQPGQVEYLQACHKLDYFSCVALGYEAALDAFEDFLRLHNGY